MAALKIQCFLNENQMDSLTDYVSKKLFASRKDEVEDIDTCFETMAIRLCVDYSIGFDSIELKQAEILDEHWNVIDADSAVLRSRLRDILNSYNYTESGLTESSRHRRQEQFYSLS